MAAVCQQCGAAGTEGDRFCARCGAALRQSAGAPNDPLLGRTVGGAYTLNELVGVGGMGRVYRAEQTTLGRTVAVKVIHPHLLGDDRIVARFYNEARAASRLNHPNSVGIIDFGRTDDGILYLAMEHLEGKDLALMLYEDGPLPIQRVCRLLDGVLGALGEAHALGVVHRDLKPENVIVKQLRAGGDLVKVVDFGLATIVSGEGATSITSAGMVCGTPDYMSPEQGRGDPVDGRGDVYALGVVLFELLTDQLPFEDETPTRVVLRHINDPVPDPREVAPGRSIPPQIAAIATRAMAKSPDDRFATAEEMQQALREAAEALRASDRPEVTCPACGERSPSSMRFCGSCGARIARTGEAPRRSPLPAAPAYRPPDTDQRKIVGREAELEALWNKRRAAFGSGASWVHLTGEAGVGKTRLIREHCLRRTEQGDLVVASGPHPTRTPVPYHAIRELVTTLLDRPAVDLAELAADDILFDNPLARAGIREIASPTGLTGVPQPERVGAVAEALACVLRAALAGGEVGALLVVDDLDACDSLTRRVLHELPALVSDEPLVLATAGPANWSLDGADELPLLGLDLNAAGHFLSYRTDDGRRSTVMSGRFMLPLYLEQVEVMTAQGGDAVPPRLADAVAQRLQQLEVDALRLLQAISVLGDRCQRKDLEAMGDVAPLSALDGLQDQRLVQVAGDEIRVIHPFIRDLVHASIPAEARRSLHRQALSLASDREAPLEVRADHAYRGADPMSALMLLERMGNRALERGDAAAALLAFRRALELARSEMLESGDTMLEGAILTFSRKLGEALERQGDVVGADGVLREALDLAGPASSERWRMMLALGRVAARRGRHRDAVRQLGLALELAEELGDGGPVGRIQLEMARARRADGDEHGAVNAYHRSLEASGVAGAERAAAMLELAALLLQEDGVSEARDLLASARSLAEREDMPALTAAAIGEAGRVCEAAGDGPGAAGLFREAARVAAEAGDADGHRRWRLAADRLGDTPLAESG